MSRITAEHKRLLIELYLRTPRTVDDLPYTEDFEELYTTFIARSGLIMTRHDLWCALTGLRKARKLPRKKHTLSPDRPDYPCR